MKISDFLSPAEVLFGLRVEDRDELLREFARMAATKVKLPDSEIAAELLKRETLGSTGMGEGVAIPHARYAKLRKPFGMMAKLKQPIEFQAIDNHPVDLVFLLLLPATTEGEQLGALACVARKLRAADELAKLRRSKNSAELYAVLTA